MSKYTLHFKYQAVLHYLHIRSQQRTADHYGISRTHLRRWIRAYQEGGIGALEHPQSKTMTDHRKNPFIADKPDHEKTQAELIEELCYMRAEVAYLKELKALIRAKKAYRHPAMGEISEHLLKRRFTAKKPNEKWLTDVTELKGKDGKLYLSPILDLFNREIVAYAMSRRADSEMVKEMLEKAAPRLTDKGTMLHSDQGVLYRTAGYRELLAEHSMVQSMSRKANCWDNAPMESFFAVLKTECFYNAGELTVDELMKQIDDYMDYYNRERCSLKLKKLSPVAYRTQLTQSA